MYLEVQYEEMDEAFHVFHNVSIICLVDYVQVCLHISTFTCQQLGCELSFKQRERSNYPGRVDRCDRAGGEFQAYRQPVSY